MLIYSYCLKLEYMIRGQFDAKLPKDPWCMSEGRLATTHEL